MGWLLLALLIVHIIICVFIYIAVRTGAMEAAPQMLPIAFFVPIWGIIAVFYANSLTKQGKAGIAGGELDELLLYGGDFHKIAFEDEKTVKTVVPLEEAIRINDTKVRRKLMMDIMRQDPDKYIRLLQQARLNDDIEVTHYASTAMMEVQRKYEVELHGYERRLQEDANDSAVLDEYIRMLKRYIGSGMLEDNMLTIQRIRLDSLLKKKIATHPYDKQPYLDLVENLTELTYYGEAEKMLRFLVRRWSGDEGVWVARLKLYFESGNKPRFDETISEIKGRRIYISAQFRHLLSFWEQSDRGA